MAEEVKKECPFTKEQLDWLKNNTQIFTEIDHLDNGLGDTELSAVSYIYFNSNKF